MVMQTAEPTTDTITPEYIACARDPVRFLSHTCIQQKGGGPIPFSLWPAQERLLRLFASPEYLLFVILKARQLGITWLSLGFALWHATFTPSASVLVLSKREEDAKDLLARVKFMHEHLPPFLKREIRSDNVLKLVFSNLSKIQALPSTEDAGRQEAATLVISDEYAYQQYAQANLAAILPTIADGGGRFIALSTADGVGNTFHRIWDENHKGIEWVKDADGAIWYGRKPGEGGFLPIFLNWRARPERNDAWYEAQVRSQGAIDPEKVHQEYPLTPDEAFLQSGRAVFAPEVCRVTAVHCVPREFSEYTPAVMAALPLGGYLKVYQLPNPLRRYTMFADTAEGLATGDFSVGLVLDAESGDEVALLRGKWPPQEFANYLKALRDAYGALLGVERNAVGVATLSRLEELDCKGLYHDTRPLERPGELPRQGLPGWRTTNQTKPLMITDLAEALYGGWVKVASQEVADELRVYERDDQGRTNAPEGYHDDCVMALAGAWQMRKHLDQLPLRGPVTQPGTDNEYSFLRR